MKTIKGIRLMKNMEKISAITCYDANMAKIADSCGIDILLVGDSVANVLLGYKDTKSISTEEMLHHCRAVARAKPKGLIVGDMPIHSYGNGKTALQNAKKFIATGCDAVKIEGAKIGVVKVLRKNKIEVMGHVGLLPQTARSYKVKGKEMREAKRILDNAVALDEAGCFAVVLECIPMQLAKKITEAVSCPAIGIGAGKYCDGQVLVVNDMLGFNADGFRPKFVKRYANLADEARKAIAEFREEVKEGRYPGRGFAYA